MATLTRPILIVLALMAIFLVAVAPAGGTNAEPLETNSPYEADILAPIGIIFAPGFYGVPGMACRLLTSDGTTTGTPLGLPTEEGIPENEGLVPVTQAIECFPTAFPAFDPLPSGCGDYPVPGSETDENGEPVPPVTVFACVPDLFSAQIQALALVNWEANMRIVSNDSRFDIVGPIRADFLQSCHFLNVSGRIHLENDVGVPAYETCAGKGY